MSTDQTSGLSEAERKRQEAWAVPPSAEAQAVFSAAWQRIDRQAWFVTQVRCGLRRTVPSVVWMDEPRAYTEHHADGSTSLVIHEGLICFTHDVVNALFASARWRGEREALPLESADELLRRCYANWKEFFDGNQERPQFPPLSDAVDGLAAVHRAAALCFVALHEYGHAALHRGREAEPRAKLEEEADRWGFDALLTLFRHDPGSEFSYVAAGGFLVPRLFSALQRFGVKFPDSYPTPAERMQSLLDVLRDRVPDEICLALATSSAMTLSMRMRAAEAAVAGGHADDGLSEAEFSATMTALLLEVGWGKLSLECLLTTMEKIGFSLAEIRDRKKQMDRLYRADQPTLLNPSHPYRSPATIVVATWPKLRSMLVQ